MFSVPSKKVYIYDATGVKQRKTVSTGTTTDYASNFVYENNTLQFFNTTEGYVEPTGDVNKPFQYVYQYKDHLGNIRLSYKDISTTSTPILQIQEENNYYPFGPKHKGYNSNINGTHHKYMFGGKEFDESFQTLNTYDFGARNYDPTLGRWMNIDPLAEQMRRHSPYNYAFNNPIYFIDPDGMAPESGGGPGDELIKKAKEGANNILTKFYNLVFSLGGNDKSELPSIEGSKEEREVKNKESKGSKLDTLGKFNKSVDKNAGDVAIGMIYVAGDALDKGGSKVTEKANTLTLATGGTTGKLTVPIATTATVTSIGGKGLKGFALSLGGYKDAAANEAVDAAISTATTVTSIKGGDKLVSKGYIKSGIQRNNLSAAWDFITSPLTKKDD